MIKVHAVSVFTDENGQFGDAATVVVDKGRKITDAERQTIAKKLDTGETAFINDLEQADISIMHPQGEIDFADVAVLGAAWLIAKLKGGPVTTLKGRARDITVLQEGELYWVQADPAIMPPWNFKQLESADSVEAIKEADTASWQHTVAWAWIDESAGLVRAKTFAADWDIPEAQGNGSGSLLLAAQLRRSIEIRHGEGAVIFARAAGDQAEVGGRVVEMSFY